MIRKSYGIILFKRDMNNHINFLMIKKTKSYCFCKFVMGKYKNTDKDLIKLFNNMTYHEKVDIMKLDYSLLWYKMNLNTIKNLNAKSYSNYVTKKNKFESLYIHDNGKKLKRLINNSFNCDTEWEFPKGKSNSPEELGIQTAIREFEEETKMKKNQYRLLLNIIPFVESYKDYGITYKTTYYYAELLNGSYKYSFLDFLQSREVQSIKWMTKDKLLRDINLPKITQDRIIKKIKTVICNYKKYKKYNKHIITFN